MSSSRQRPEKTYVAGPVIRILPSASESIERVPPASWTSMGHRHRAEATAAAVEAHAPVPHASVCPAPRSHVS